MESKKQVKLNNEKPFIAKSRNWISTINNPIRGARFQFELAISVDNISYAKGQEEEGLEGTKHLQVYTNWKHPISLSQIRKLWPLGHHEICKNPSAAMLYCGKAETRLDGPWVHGVDPIARSANKKVSVKDLLKYTEEELQELGPNSYLITKKALSIVPGQEFTPQACRGIWIYGKPGTGKSRFAFEHYQGAYRKAQNKWFDGYQGQTCIILDDLDKLGGQTLGHYLKIWGDRYPCTGEVKGFTVQLRHDFIIVTSNYTIEEMWPEDQEMSNAIRRRFKCLRFVVPGTPGQNRDPTRGDVEISYRDITTLDESAKRELAGGVQRQSECLQHQRDSSDAGQSVGRRDTLGENESHFLNESDEEFDQLMEEINIQTSPDNEYII